MRTRSGTWEGNMGARQRNSQSSVGHGELEQRGLPGNTALCNARTNGARGLVVGGWWS